MSTCGEPCDGCPNRAEHHLCDACCHDEVDAIRKENRELSEKLEWQSACTKALMESQERSAAEISVLRALVNAPADDEKTTPAEEARIEAYQTEKLTKERDELRHHLSNLLARIHRDGGHYEAEHGTDTAVSGAKAIEIPVIIGTERQNLWFGYTTDTTGSTVTLKRARQIIYWSSSVKGAGGLAVTGPDETCRIGPAVPEVEARGVLTVVKPTAEAVKAFEAAPWAR